MEQVLQYAILLFYYPFIDLKKAVDILWEFGKDDESCMILGCFYCCYYIFDDKPKENIFLNRLLQNIKQFNAKTQALIYMMAGVSDGLRGNKEQAMRCFEKALERDAECVAIYKEIIYFSSPYSSKSKEAKRKVNRLQRKISLAELEAMQLKERISFSFFEEMEIRKNIKRPVGFVEEWK